MTEMDLEKEQLSDDVTPLFGVTSELVQEVHEKIEQKDSVALNQLIDALHEADVAELIEHLGSEDRKFLIASAAVKIDAEVLALLNESVRDDVLEHLSTVDLAAVVSDLDSDDALSLIEDLDQEQQREVLRAISAEDRAILEELLTYPEDSAGRLMQHSLVVVPTHWTIGDVLSHIKTVPEIPDNFYEVFVVDPKHHPVGSFPLSELLRHNSNVKVSDIMSTQIKRIPVNTDQEEVARIFRHYGLVGAPVVDHSNRIVGVIAVDDVVDVINEEANEDILHLARVSSESDFGEPAITTSYRRLRWLIFTLFSTLVSASVISQFQITIEKMVALAVLMPIVTAMGGNSGMQVVTVIVRALATREIRDENTVRIISKELLVGMITSLSLAVFLGVLVGLWYQDYGLSLVLGFAIIFNMLWAAFAGTLLPIVISRFKMDPAIGAGPLLTTTTDALGFAIFLGLASLFLLK